MKVRMRLVGEDGNAFAIMGRFRRAARDAGWSAEEISDVLEEAMAGDYDHLLATMMEHVDEPRDGEEDDDA
jgi:hypothetical protein